MADELTLGDALEALWKENRLDAAAGEAPSWSCRLGPITLRLPNFAWRRQAILRHDLHHLLTGYPCTMRGEFQMAAWEFAAGRFPHPAATLFCLPLVAIGLVWSPRAIWLAFRAGRRGRSLYGTRVTAALLRRPLRQLRRELSPETRVSSSLADRLAFARLVAEALLLAVLPGALGLLLLLSI